MSDDYLKSTEAYHERKSRGFPFENGKKLEDAITGEEVTVRNERTEQGLAQWVNIVYDNDVEVVDEYDESRSQNPNEVPLWNHQESWLVPATNPAPYQWLDKRMKGETVLGATVRNPEEYINPEEVEYVVGVDEHHIAYEAYGSVCVAPTSVFLLRRVFMMWDEYKKELQEDRWS